ncbi:hypothetical protein BEL04_17735 [Mucilaginibacter sp. PPCGB 2223]|nr:hypothetical protein BEL04_17735 [Mucilaginibacter sp. PPCGB 2223]
MLFSEIQKFRQWWLWLILIVTLMPLLGILIYQVITGNPVGDKPASNGSLIVIVLLVGLPLVLGFCYFKLFTVVERDAIYYGFGIKGNKLNELRLADIASMDVIPYRSFGLGMRLSRQYGTIYNTNWGKGLVITKTDGSKLVIGTQRPEELKVAISKMRK